jgi:uncharacterized protein (DUF2267 family)
MSATGLDVFDKTLQATNSWFDKISEALHRERNLAWKVLSVVLHKLRDRIPVDLSAHPRNAVRAVFAVLSRHVPRGQIAKVQHALPEDLRASWMSAEERVVPPPD